MKDLYFGFGTYRIRVKNPKYIEALTYAPERGIRLLDTSANLPASIWNGPSLWH